MSERLAGRVALVTGAASGIGRATARRLAAEGARVGVADLDGEGAARTAATIGEGAVAIEADVSDPAAAAAMVGAVLERFGALDVLHANAAIPQAVSPIEELPVAAWQRVIAVNLTGTFLCIQAALPALRQARGAIIATSSIASIRPRDGIAAYSASKAGVNGLVRALAFELAPSGVRVNGVAPGPLDTPLLAGMAFGDSAAQTVERARAGLPLGELVEPEDIAAAVAYLASDDARHVTGILLPVDAGRGL